MLKDTGTAKLDKLRKDRKPIVEQCTCRFEQQKDEEDNVKTVKVNERCGKIELAGSGKFDEQENEILEEVCEVWWKPEAKFRNGWLCPSATHLEVEAERKGQQGKRRVGQQKQRRF